MDFPWKWEIPLWFSPFRCTSCTHLLCPRNTGPCSWSTSLWLKPDWPTSRSGKNCLFWGEFFLDLSNPAVCDLLHLCPRTGGHRGHGALWRPLLHQWGSAGTAALSPSFPISQVPFPLEKHWGYQPPCPSKAECAAKSPALRQRVLVAISTGPPLFSWKLELHFIVSWFFSVEHLHLCGVGPKCAYSEEIWGWNLHSAVFTLWFMINLG